MQVDKNLPGMQGTEVRYLHQEEPTFHRAAKPMHRNYWDCSRAWEQQILSSWVAMTEARAPRSYALQLYKACEEQRRPSEAINK